jgi:hypothetical protein
MSAQSSPRETVGNMISSAVAVDQHDGFRIVRLKGNAYERGYQHGAALKDSVRYFCDAFYRDLLFARNRFLGMSLSCVFLSLALRMERFIPRELRDEMRGVADGAGVSYRDILILNTFDDAIHGVSKLAGIMTWVQKFRGSFACSSFVRLAESGPIHGRNLDYMVADSAVDPHGIVTRVLRENVVLFIHEPDRGCSFASVAWPGYVGVVTGMNVAGISLACHTSWTLGETIHGVPLPLLYRHVMQYSSSLSDAELRLRRARKTIGNNLSLASGPERDARALELTPGHVATWAPRDGTLAVTNHFQDPALGEPQERAGWLFPNSTSRLERLHELLPSAPSTLDAAQAILMDTTPVRPDLGEWDCLANPGTIYSTVFDPVNLQISLRIYDRPDREFQTIDLADCGAAALAA